MIPKIDENEVIFYYKDSKTCGVALNCTRSFVEEKFYVIDSVAGVDECDDVRVTFNKLFNTMVDIVDILDPSIPAVITIPGLLRATVLIYHDGLDEISKRHMISNAVGFILVYVKGKFNMTQALHLHRQHHIVCDEAVLAFGEVYQDYFTVNDDESMVVFGSNIITAFTIKIDCDPNAIEPFEDRKVFQECIQEMRFTKCAAPLEVRYGDTGYGIKVDLNKVRSDLTEEVDYKVGQLYNSMLSILLTTNTKE